MQKVISYSLDIDFIHRHIHNQLYEKYSLSFSIMSMNAFQFNEHIPHNSSQCLARFDSI